MSHFIFSWQCCKMRLFEKLFKQCESKGSSNGVSTFFFGEKQVTKKHFGEKHFLGEYNIQHFRV